MSQFSPETIAEVLVHLKYIRESQDRTEDHLAALNGRTAKSETRIAVLEERNPGKQGGIAGTIAGIIGGFLAGMVR